MPKPDQMKKEGAQPTYKVKFDGEVMVPMRDGVRLAVDVYRPDAKGRFPALLALGPWSKEISSDLQWTLPPQVETSTRWDGTIEAGSSQYLVSRGYAHIIAQQRGIGHSEGVMDKDCEMDGYDLVEWIAQQPWCDGNVGMVGISAFAMAQLATAITQPPHLKAIFPYDTPSDMYRDALYPGGILDTFLFGVSSRRLAVHTVDPARMAERQRLAREVKSNPDNPDIYPVRDILMYSLIYNVLCHPQVSSGSWGLFDYIVHPYDGPFYQAISFSSRYSAIKVPAYLGSGWYAYTYMHLPGAFRNYAGLNVPKKLMIGPGATIEKPLMVSSDPSLNRPFAGYADEVVRWYDYWLKGIDTGIMDEPPIKIFTMESCDPVCGTWRFENEWPLARTKWTKFYLRTFERLSTEPPAFTDAAPDSFVQQPLTISNKIGSCKYQTRSLHEDLTITGPIALKLYASIDTDDDNWIVALRDVAPDGKRFELTRGWLKCSHRALDESKSKPWQPYHLHTKEAVEKIQPGKIYDYDIEIRPTSNKFKAGHRIELEIMSVDSPPPRAVEHLSSYHICANHTCYHKIYRDPEYPSHLLLPVIPQE
jgi:putative CocE/NonD family hydrolase